MAELSINELDARARKRFENANTAIERGNFEYTIEICCSLLQQSPGCLEARELLRRAQQCVYARPQSALRRARNQIECALWVAFGRPYAKKDPVKAMDYGERALSRHPFNRPALSLVAAGAETLGLYQTAVLCLKSICDRDTKDVALLQRYCEALIKVGETSQAIGIAERLGRLKPGHAGIQELVKSASVAHSINRGKWAEGERDFRSKLKDSSMADKLERDARLLADEDAAELKAQDIMLAIEQEPGSIELYKRLVKTLLVKRDFESALEWLERAFAQPQGEADLTLRQYRSEIRIMATEEELEKLRSRPGKPSSQNAKRIQILERELDSLRLEETRKMVEQFPNDFGQRLKYGELLLSDGRVDEAIQQFQVSQRSSNLKHRSSLMLGKSFMQKGLFDLALEQLDRAMDTASPMDAFKKDVLYVSAECCERLGRREEAIRRYKLIYSSDIRFRDVAEKIDAHYSREEG